MHRTLQLHFLQGCRCCFHRLRTFAADCAVAYGSRKLKVSELVKQGSHCQQWLTGKELKGDLVVLGCLSHVVLTLLLKLYYVSRPLFSWWSVWCQPAQEQNAQHVIAVVGDACSRCGNAVGDPFENRAEGGWLLLDGARVENVSWSRVNCAEIRYLTAFFLASQQHSNLSSPVRTETSDPISDRH